MRSPSPWPTSRSRLPAPNAGGAPRPSPTGPTAAGGSAVTVGTILLGVGLGGLFDGIVLHQILQWHHMLSAQSPPDSLSSLELNTLADGLFHAVAWVFTLIGVLLIWGAMRHGASLGWSRLVGGLLAGWGGFNLVEGLVDHHVLGVHHVRPGPDQLLYDVGFLAWGGIMLAAGIFLLRPTVGDRA
jgi:uncharacterized membrane protein